MLTPEQDAVIYAAIHADPVLDGFARAGNDSEVAARLNSQTVTVYRRVSTGQVRLWSAVRGLRQKLQELALNGTNGKQSMALVFLRRPAKSRQPSHDGRRRGTRWTKAS